MTNQTFITQEGLKKLEQELEYLKTDKRKEIANRIQSAKDLGDLSENAEYSDAKDAQAFNDGRIMELQEVIRNATIIKEHQGSGAVAVGNSIKIKDEETGDIREYEIVGSQEADPVGGKISNESPLGKAFLNKKKGDMVEITLPKGIVRYEIIEIF
ncbi:MAG: transcription elongation factor GreA [Patescibacteria group bacterium]